MTELTPEFGTQIAATFQPKRLETLRRENHPLIGQRLTFTYAWTVDDEDGGPYVGQAVWIAHDDRADSPRLHGWVPDEDLTDIEPINQEPTS